MRPWALAFALAASLPGAARAAPPWLQIRGAAVRVAIVPEARRDIRITVLRTNRRLPLRIHVERGRTVISGDVNRRVRGCAGTSTVDFWGRGKIAYAQLPFVVARTPLDVRVAAGDAVFGIVGRSASLDLTNQGCGTWTIANVRGRMRLDQAGAGVTRAGGGRGADLSVAGSGFLSVGPVDGSLSAVSSGSGDIAVASVRGSVDVRVAGTGDVSIAGGAAARMTASIAGSGDIHMGGSAASLVASVTGSGAIDVAHVTGPVQRQVFGAGEVRTGP